MSAGKGSKPRPVDPKVYAANFDAIRWKSRPPVGPAGPAGRHPDVAAEACPPACGSPAPAVSNSQIPAPRSPLKP